MTNLHGHPRAARARDIRSLARAFAFALLLPLAAAAMPSAAARADCSDPTYGCTFVLPETLLVPPAFGGVPAWRASDCYEYAQGSPLADRFVVERHGERRWYAVPFRVRFAVDAPAIAGWPARERHELLVVVPDSGFAPGAEYRVTRKELASIPPVTTLVRVAAAAPARDTTSARLRMGEPVAGPLVFDDLPGGGFPHWRAVSRRLTLELPQAWRPYAPCMLVSTLVDGRRWQPVLDACRRGTPAGVTAFGGTADVVFAPCGGAAGAPADPRWGPEPVPYALENGHHVVEMRAWLPGTDRVWSARADVSLDCR